MNYEFTKATELADVPTTLAATAVVAANSVAPGYESIAPLAGVDAVALDAEQPAANVETPQSIFEPPQAAGYFLRKRMRVGSSGPRARLFVQSSKTNSRG